MSKPTHIDECCRQCHIALPPPPQHHHKQGQVWRHQGEKDGWAASTEQGVPILMTVAKVRLIFLISFPIPLTFATDLPGDTVTIASTLIRTQRPHEHLKCPPPSMPPQPPPRAHPVSTMLTRHCKPHRPSSSAMLTCCCQPLQPSLSATSTHQPSGTSNTRQNLC